MNDLLNYFISKFGNVNKHQKSMRIQPLEINVDVNGEPYVFITPITKSKFHPYRLEDLIEDYSILNKLEDKSRDYAFYAYGMLKISEKNNFFMLKEIFFLNKEILVTNISTKTDENWNKDKFETNYALLDKKSLKKAAEFFYKMIENPGSFINQKSTDRTLKLVK